jgi:hypothetical protein
MHYYDCPCEDCRIGAPTDRLFERVLDVVERLERELARPATKEYDEALAWLSRICGGPDAVAALDAAPLADSPPAPDGQRPAAVAALLDAVATEFFDTEMRHAFRRALAAVWDTDRALVLAPVMPGYVASGIAWTVGEANGLVGAHHHLTATRLKLYLDTVSGPAVHARPIRRALGEEWIWRADEPRRGTPRSDPALIVLGRTDLLVARTRARLVRVRDHALGERDADRAGDPGADGATDRTADRVA